MVDRKRQVGEYNSQSDLGYGFNRKDKNGCYIYCQFWQMESSDEIQKLVNV